jgi:hypothetical protein
MKVFYNHESTNTDTDADTEQQLQKNKEQALAKSIDKAMARDMEYDFVDRRKQQQPLNKPCRRGFASLGDSNPWWLKTNYLTNTRSNRAQRNTVIN